MKSKLLAVCLVLSSMALPLIGCGSSDGDPNYKTEVKLTDEQRQKAQAEAARQNVPKVVDPKQKK